MENGSDAEEVTPQSCDCRLHNDPECKTTQIKLRLDGVMVGHVMLLDRMQKMLEGLERVEKRVTALEETLATISVLR